MNYNPAKNIREIYLQEVKLFTDKVKTIDGVIRIAMIGSLTTYKSEPKDIDMLLTIEDDLDLSRLAKITRQMNGHVQAYNHNAEVFLSNPQYDYIGRICHWKDCGPGIRASCDAMHCGLREYLHDDFGSVELEKSLIINPPIVLWPEVKISSDIPWDLTKNLLINDNSDDNSA
jgi:hypothetical protein